MLHMEHLGKNIKKLLTHIGINESRLAQNTGISQPVIHRMTSGETQNPKIASLLPIASFFDITVEQLIGTKPLPLKISQPSAMPDRAAFAVIPLLNWHEIDNWLRQNQECQHTMMSCDSKISKLGFAVMVKDTTMRPSFPENSTLIIEPERQACDRDFAIIKLQSSQPPIFRQVLYDGVSIHLKALNPEFRSYKLERQDKILGVVIQVRKYLYD